MVLCLKFGQRLAHINEVHISECPSSPCWMQIAKGYLHARHGGVVATSCLIFKFQCSASTVTAQGDMSLDGLTYQHHVLTSDVVSAAKKSCFVFSKTQNLLLVERISFKVGGGATQKRRFWKHYFSKPFHKGQLYSWLKKNYCMK